MQTVLASGIYFPVYAIVTSGDPREKGFMDRVRSNLPQIVAGTAFTCAVQIMCGPLVAVSGMFIIVVGYKIINNHFASQAYNQPTWWDKIKSSFRMCWASVLDAFDEIASDFEDSSSEEETPKQIHMVDFETLEEVAYVDDLQPVSKPELEPQSELKPPQTKPQLELKPQLPTSPIDEKVVIQKTLSQGRLAKTLTEKSLKSLYKTFKEQIDSDPALKEEIRKEAVKCRQLLGQQHRRVKFGIMVPVSQSSIEWLT